MNMQRKSWVPRWSWLGLGVVGAMMAYSGSAESRGEGPVRWSEPFRAPLDWASPRQSTAQIRQVYGVRQEQGVDFLHAVHDAVPSEGKTIPPAVHYGRAFRSPELRLADACNLSWRWRVPRHPTVGADAWQDVAASVYVVTRTPSLLSGGRGFKFGWLSKPGAVGTKQRGIVQIELRHDAASSAWKAEQVDLCDLYRTHYGAVGDERLLYVGVVTDADNTKSVAEADYADFVVRGN